MAKTCYWMLNCCYLWGPEMIMTGPQSIYVSVQPTDHQCNVLETPQFYALLFCKFVLCPPLLDTSQ